MAKGDYITHCNPVRLRVTGSGNLLLGLFDLGNTNFQYLSPIAMSTVTGKFRDALANFRSERIQLEFRVTEENEYFTISTLVPHVKPTAASYPLL